MSADACISSMTGWAPRPSPPLPQHTWRPTEVPPIHGLTLVFRAPWSASGGARRMAGVRAVLESRVGGAAQLRLAVYDRRGRAAVSTLHLHGAEQKEFPLLPGLGKPSWQCAARDMTWWLVFETPMQQTAFRGLLQYWGERSSQSLGGHTSAGASQPSSPASPRPGMGAAGRPFARGRVLDASSPLSRPASYLPRPPGAEGCGRGAGPLRPLWPAPGAFPSVSLAGGALVPECYPYQNLPSPISSLHSGTCSLGAAPAPPRSPNPAWPPAAAPDRSAAASASSSLDLFQGSSPEENASLGADAYQSALEALSMSIEGAEVHATSPPPALLGGRGTPGLGAAVAPAGHANPPLAVEAGEWHALRLLDATPPPHLERQALALGCRAASLASPFELGPLPDLDGLWDDLGGEELSPHQGRCSGESLVGEGVAKRARPSPAAALCAQRSCPAYFTPLALTPFPG
uniref:Uncharacterized protein n=3 Tax=Auxenochlorella protothecoides TaxID=3075 RepID=A0A1D2AB75_AUXPR